MLCKAVVGLFPVHFYVTITTSRVSYIYSILILHYTTAHPRVLLSPKTSQIDNYE